MAKRRGLQNFGFTSVGYGLQWINPVFVESARVRMFAAPHLIRINTGFAGDSSLLLSNNHSVGGTCFGDSGGVYRIDTADDLDWLATFGLVP